MNSVKNRFAGYVFKKWKHILLAGICLVVLMIGGINWYVCHVSSSAIENKIDNFKGYDVAMVLGAKVFPDGRLSDMMKDRADKALELYKAGLVKKILVSGDHGTDHYDETNTIRNYLLGKGIPREDVFMDHAGFTTFNSMYRARDVFKVKKMIVISQKFHLYRALYLADHLGLEVKGLEADQHNYNRWGLFELNVREVVACCKAVWQVDIANSKPRFLGTVIPIKGDGRMTEDKSTPAQ